MLRCRLRLGQRLDTREGGQDPPRHAVPRRVVHVSCDALAKLTGRALYYSEGDAQVGFAKHRTRHEPGPNGKLIGGRKSHHLDERP